MLAQRRQVRKQLKSLSAIALGFPEDLLGISSEMVRTDTLLLMAQALFDALVQASAKCRLIR